MANEDPPRKSLKDEEFLGLVIRSLDYGQKTELVSVCRPTSFETAEAAARAEVHRRGSDSHYAVIVPVRTVHVCGHRDLTIRCRDCNETFQPGDRVGDRVILEPLTTGGRPL